MEEHSLQRIGMFVLSKDFPSIDFTRFLSICVQTWNPGKDNRNQTSSLDVR